MVKVNIISNILFLGLATMLLFSGCNHEKKFTPKTKNYYLKNIEIAKSRVSECKKIGAAKEEIRIDCTNAQMAINEIISKSNSPIIGNETKKSKW